MSEEQQTPDQWMTPESAKAFTDSVIGNTTVQKKVPDVDDVDGQIKAICGALASALLTSTEMPLHVLQPVVTDMATQMVAYGVRQTEHADPDAVHAPAWITDGVRQESMVVPPQPAHTEAEPVEARTAEAPTCPKRIKTAARAVRL